MRIVTAAEMQELDRHAIEDLGIPSITLMENAGKAVAEEVVKLSTPSKTLVICGKGNNGGDGLVCARYLAQKGSDVLVLLLGHVQELKKDPKDNLEKLKAVPGVKLMECPDLKCFEGFKKVMQGADLIIDAIFGIGLNSEVRSPYAEIITFLNSLPAPKLAVDIPSGLDATSGKILGTVVKAAKTVTFAALKRGLVEGDGPDCSGEIKVVDIGIPVNE